MNYYPLSKASFGYLYYLTSYYVPWWTTYILEAVNLSFPYLFHKGWRIMCAQVVSYHVNTNNRSNSLHCLHLSIIIDKFRANNNNAIVRKSVLYSRFCCRFALLSFCLLSIRFPLFFSDVLIFLSFYFLHFSHLIRLDLFLIIRFFNDVLFVFWVKKNVLLIDVLIEHINGLFR